jgi:hypothetical protein
MVDLPLFQTDQHACYDENGRAVPCPGTGQDGEYRHGIAWPKPRFDVLGNIVLDKLTGLFWTRNASLSQFPLNWSEAHEFVEKLNSDHYADRNDWRLPERRELFSLISHAGINPSLPEDHPFCDVFHGYYWTATPCSRLPRQAWYVHLGGGRVFKGMKHGSYMVWPVGARPEPLPRSTSRFEVRESTVTDRVTGLMWTRGADLTGGRKVNWSDALAVVRTLNISGASGFDDWRLPNVRELESLVDPYDHSPALSKHAAFTNVQDAYWSATTSVYEPAYAWVLYTVDGTIGVGYKPGPEFFVWAVRGDGSRNRPGV